MGFGIWDWNGIWDLGWDLGFGWDYGIGNGMEWDLGGI